MRTRLLFICAALCIGLAAYYAYFEVYITAQGNQELNQTPKVFFFEKKDIVGISIKSKSLLLIEKKGAIWCISLPISSSVDQREIDGLLSTIANLRIARSFTSDGSLAQFGLEEPALTIIVHTVKGQYTLSIGEGAPASSYVYATVSGNKDILLIPAQDKTGLDKDLFELRDKRLVAMDYSSINKIRIMRNEMILEFIRDGEENWHLVGDHTRRLDSVQIQLILQQVRESEARSYPGEAVVAGAPDAAIELASPKDIQKVEIWEQGGKVYAISDYQKNNVEISENLLNMLPVDPGEVVDKTILSLSGVELKKVVFSGREEKVYLKHGDGWYSGSRKVRNTDAFNSVMRLLNRTRYGDEFLLLPKEAVKKLGIRMYGAEVSPAFDMQIYSQYYVSVGKRIYRINEGDMNSLLKYVNVLLEEHE